MALNTFCHFEHLESKNCVPNNCVRTWLFTKMCEFLERHLKMLFLICAIPMWFGLWRDGKKEMNILAQADVDLKALRSAKPNLRVACRST